FMTEIAALLAAATADLGYEVDFPAAGLPSEGRDRVNVVVAPHEFFTLQEGVSESDLLRAASACAVVGVEQPGTDWFELGTHYASAARAIFDISPHATAELLRRDLPATHLQLGYHPTWDRWGGDPTRLRHTDVLFLGSSTARREDLLGEAAPLLWDCHADLRLFEFLLPMNEPTGHFLAGADKWDLLAGSRILLNVHRNEVPYFEWVRVLESIVNGCLVVTELSSDYGPLVPGEHLVAAPADALAAYAASLALDENLRAELAGNAYHFVRSKLELTNLLAPFWDDLTHQVGAPRTAGEVHPYRPAGPGAAQPVAPIVRELDARYAAAGARIKAVLDSESRLSRSVEALQARLAYGDANHSAVTPSAAWAGFRPEVSVVVTCYNYGERVARALDSVLACSGVEAEIVVVDDHSSDSSVDRVKGFIEDHPWFPALLLARSANGGVSAARNAAFAAARADRVFVLDADNAVYPHCLAKLSAALDAHPEAGFSYGILAKEGAPGLLSQYPWDTRRLVFGPYIDAMSMIRRSVWEELGGYDEVTSLLGWE
ncbi:MAG: glycosyltransferase, partial [Acidimicrobiales bacterium]